MSTDIVIPIDAEVAEVLRRCEVLGDPDRVVLPPGKLDRALYERVDKTLRALGGRWDRRRGAHVFDAVVDLRARIDDLGRGKAVIDRKKTLQAYYTPYDLAQRMVQLAGIRADDRVLEPSAGYGAIARVATELGAHVTCVEVDPVAVAALCEQCHAAVHQEDFLTFTPMAALGRFDAVVMNPPFSKSQDVHHVLHAWRFVRPGGTLVAIVSPGFTFRKGLLYDRFRKMLADATTRESHDLPPDTFADQGVKVRTVLLRLTRS